LVKLLCVSRMCGEEERTWPRLVELERQREPDQVGIGAGLEGSHAGAKLSEIVELGLRPSAQRFTQGREGTYAELDRLVRMWR
jgi:hypothetical protein